MILVGIEWGGARYFRFVEIFEGSCVGGVKCRKMEFEGCVAMQRGRKGSWLHYKCSCVMVFSRE